jgi:hypothetical protein
MWDGYYSPSGLASTLNAAPRNPLSDADSYSIVNVHPWSTGFAGDAMSNVQDVVDMLDSAVKVVTVEEFMIHLRNNFGRPVATDCNDNGIRDLTETRDLREAFFADGSSTDFQINGSASAADGLIELTQGAGHELGTVVLTAPSPEPVTAFEARFDFRCGFGSGGEGFSFTVMDAGTYATTTVFGEQGPGPDALTIEFDTNHNEVELWVDGLSLGAVVPAFTMDDLSWHQVEITLRDSAVTVRIEVRRGIWETVFAQTALAGYAPMVSLYGLGARTSALTNSHQIDNVQIAQCLAADANCNTVVDTCEDGGDLNHDGGHSSHDIAWMLACFNGPDAEPKCGGAPRDLADADDDGDVDLRDYAEFEAAFEGQIETTIGPNVVYNPDMEAGSGGWPADWFHSATLVSWSTDSSVSPTHSLRISDDRTDERGEWRSHAVLIDGVDTLHFSWHERSFDINGQFEAAIRFFDSVDAIGNATGTFHGEVLQALDEGTNLSWRQQEMIVPVPAAAGSFDLIFRSYGAGGNPTFGATGILWIDDVYVGEVQ